MIQLQFLNHLLNTGDTSLITLNNINGDYFSEYKDEFDFIQNHINKYGCIPDKETFVNKFPNFDIITVNESPSYLIDELVKDKNARYLASTFNDVRKLLLEDKIDEAQRTFTLAANNTSKGVQLEAVDVLNDTSRYDSYVDKCEDYKKYYVNTGFPELDKIIGGWDRREELVTIVARTNMGKSWILFKSSIASAEQGLNVGIYEGEMGDDKVGYRIDTLISHISNGQIIHGNKMIQNDYKKYIDNLPHKLPGKIWVLTTKGIGGSWASVSTLKAFIEKYNLDILCIDQRSLMEDDRKARNPIDKAADISLDLKNLQVMKKIPIITVSQQNRTKNEDGSIDTTQISQSDRIGQDSTMVIAFDQKDSIITMHLIKSRDSVNMKDIKYKVDFDKGQFDYIAEGDNPISGDKLQELENRYKDNSESKGSNVF